MIYRSLRSNFLAASELRKRRREQQEDRNLAG
jgi:hypothetical protein